MMEEGFSLVFVFKFGFVFGFEFRFEFRVSRFYFFVVILISLAPIVRGAVSSI